MARRREREHVASDDRGQPRSGGQRGGPSRDPAGGGGKPGGGNRKPSNRNRGRNRNRKKPRNHEVGFWGDVDRLPEPTQDVRITDDPAAVARSLGPPPLPGHEAIAEHYFRVVYERAVTTAGALAAAGGLIDPEALAAEMSDG